MQKERTLATGYRRELPYKRKLVLITTKDDPKNVEIRGTINTIWPDLLDETSFEEIDFDKHPGIAKKYGLKTIKTSTRPNPERKEGESVIDFLRRNTPVEGEALALPMLVFLEDDVVEWQHQGIVKDYTLWAAMTRKPVYNQPGDGVVPVNYFS